MSPALVIVGIILAVLLGILFYSWIGVSRSISMYEENAADKAAKKEQDKKDLKNSKKYI